MPKHALASAHPAHKEVCPPPLFYSYFLPNRFLTICKSLPFNTSSFSHQKTDIMSDADKSASDATNSGPKFSERELQLLGWAMQSIKGGPPDVNSPSVDSFVEAYIKIQIDYNKLAEFASMSNPRSAYNAWSKIKGKLMVPSDGAGPSTPVKGSAKKKAPVKDDGETPKKTPAKRGAKKQDIDGEGSPKKKGRGKKIAAADAGQDSDKSDNVPVKAEIKEEADEDAED